MESEVAMVFRKRRIQRRGTEILELALLFLPLMWLSLGAVDFGYFFYVQHNAQGAAREGVRAGIPSGATDADITSAAARVMVAAGFKGKYTLSISPSATNATERTPLTVTVEIPYQAMGLPPARVKAAKVTGIVVMAKE
jgi:Flp pilus assembly protein TadG